MNTNADVRLKRGIKMDDICNRCIHNGLCYYDKIYDSVTGCLNFKEKGEGDTEVKDKVLSHAHICEELNELYYRKNHDYGDSFHETFIEEGFVMPRIRLTDKLNRVKTLTKGAGEIVYKIDDPRVRAVYEEKLRDTLLDLANYAIMTIMELDIQEEQK